jgi:hypothetical protein
VRCEVIRATVLATNCARPGDADHQAAGHGTSSRRPKAIIRIPSLQLELPLAEIYAGIETG